MNLRPYTQYASRLAYIENESNQDAEGRTILLIAPDDFTPHLLVAVWSHIYPLGSDHYRWDEADIRNGGDPEAIREIDRLNSRLESNPIPDRFIAANEL